MRVRSGRKTKLARMTKQAGSGSVNLILYPKVRNADQTLGFQVCVGQTSLHGWGSVHVPIAVATDAMLDRSLQIDTQNPQMPNLGARPAPLFPVAHAQAAAQPFIQPRNRLIVLADAKVPQPTLKTPPQFVHSVVHTHTSNAAREFSDPVLDVGRSFVAQALSQSRFFHVDAPVVKVPGGTQGEYSFDRILGRRLEDYSNRIQFGPLYGSCCNAVQSHGRRCAAVGGSSQPGAGPVRRRGRAFIRNAASTDLRAASHLAPAEGFHGRGRWVEIMSG